MARVQGVEVVLLQVVVAWSWLPARGAMARMDLDQFGEGARGAEGAPSTKDREREALRLEGAQHYQAGRYFHAVAAFQAALERAQTEEQRSGLKELLSRALSAHGVELFNAGESRKAQEAFRQALKEHENFYAHFGLGFFHLVRLEDAEALEDLNKALSLEPGYARTHKLLGVLEYRQGRVEQALKRMEEACRLDAQDKEAENLLRRWRTESVHSKNFTKEVRGGFVVRADPRLPRRELEQVLKLLEKVRQELGEVLAVRSSRPLVAVLFLEADFHRATGSGHWVGGFYDGQLKLPLPAVAAGTEQEAASRAVLEAVLRHEMTHVLVRELCAECPNWLNEGIAQHFEYRGAKERVAAELRARKGKRIPLREVPARLWEVKDEEVARGVYLESLRFVEFLVNTYDEFRLVLLLEAIKREGSVNRAFELVYGAGLEKLEAALWAEEGTKSGG